MKYNSKNQKALTDSQDFLTRRPVELNHILFNRTIRLSGDDQNRLVSTSHNLRNFDYNIEIKNNLSVVEEVVFDPIFSDVTSPDNYLHYSKPRGRVKGF
jgi:hypothetical protein